MKDITQENSYDISNGHLSRTRITSKIVDFATTTKLISVKDFLSLSSLGRPIRSKLLFVFLLFLEIAQQICHITWKLFSALKTYDVVNLRTNKTKQVRFHTNVKSSTKQA